MVCARAGLVMGEVVPSVPVVAVILADGSPLPFAEVGPPFLPRHTSFARLVQALLFGNVNDILDRHRSSPPNGSMCRCWGRTAGFDFLSAPGFAVHNRLPH